MDLVLKIKQSYKVKTLGGAIVQCGILSLSYKEKKSYLVPKCATYRPQELPCDFSV